MTDPTPPPKPVPEELVLEHRLSPDFHAYLAHGAIMSELGDGSIVIQFYVDIPVIKEEVLRRAADAAPGERRYGGGMARIELTPSREDQCRIHMSAKTARSVLALLKGQVGEGPDTDDAASSGAADG